MSNAPSLPLSPQPREAEEATTVSARPEPRADSVHVICNVSEGPAFDGSGSCPPSTVLTRFGADALHKCTVAAECDLSRAVFDHDNLLVRSLSLSRIDGETVDPSKKWSELIFEFGPRLFLHADRNSVSGFASSRTDAERLALDFAKKYKAPVPVAAGSFELMSVWRDNIRTENVPLKPKTILSKSLLDLHYGGDFGEWHKKFVREITESDQGLSIFEGAPGTGKTSYLRHLMGVLRESHRFYFIPPSQTSVLARPDFVEFWVGQRRYNSDRKFVVIIEEAEEALMRRGSDNSAHVSAILNLSDGLLADFTRLQIICTMNCRTTDIDPALLRPGRLSCHRVFDRLDRAAATRLAEHLGRTLPTATDYSLAEIFAGQLSKKPNRSRIGFAS